MQQQPGAMGGEKILLHIRQEAKLRFHSLLRHGLCDDLHLCMIYGMQTYTGHDGRAGEGQECCVVPGKAPGGCAGRNRTLRVGISAAPNVLVLNQAGVPDLFPISQ